MITADESRALWGAADDGIQAVPVIRYHEPWTAGSHHATHHTTRTQGSITAWDAIALSTLIRHRHPWWAVPELPDAVRPSTIPQLPPENS